MQTQFDDDNALIAQHLGPNYLGRRFLRYAELEALGLVDNRASLKLWMGTGAFPRGIKIAGRHGKALVWLAVEVARMVAERIAERDAGSPEKTGPSFSGTGPSDSDSNDGPWQAGRNDKYERPDVYPR